MDLELTCFNVSSSLPTIPEINNMTYIHSHSYYKPNGKAIFQLISSSLTSLTFSIADVRSFLKLVTSNDILSWDSSTIVNDLHIKELEELINQETNLLPEAMVLFQDIKNDNREMINYLKMPLQEPCDYANGNDTEVISIVVEALDLVHQQMNKLIDRIRNDFLSQITPWPNAMLMNKTLEDQVRCLENDTIHAMNRLNEKIFDQFNIAISSIDIKSDLNHLAEFSIAINSIRIREKVQQIEENLKNIETQFQKISTMVPTLPSGVVNQTFDNVSIIKLY
ncbi:unnamed protein product [Rotaria sp. Silwood1]|nr:unnamed protein product [Rotaria sp. Silwood1]